MVKDEVYIMDVYG